MFWFSILMMKFFASESCWYQTNGTHKLIFSHAGDWVSLFKYTQFFCELLLHSGLYGYFYWFSLPVSVRAQVILPKTGSGKVMRRGGAFGGKVGWAPLRLWWPYTSVEVALKCRKWRKALSSSLSLSLSLFLCFLSSGLVPFELSDAHFLRSWGAVRVEALKCTVRPIA